MHNADIRLGSESDSVSCIFYESESDSDFNARILATNWLTLIILIDYFYSFSTLIGSGLVTVC